MYCICCRENSVDILNLPNVLDSNRINTSNDVDNIYDMGFTGKINEQMVGDGIMASVDAGYGSIHDGDKFILAICDSCITKGIEDGTLLYVGNYMYGNDMYHIRKNIDKSKTMYRRRSNLDNLI